MVPRDKPADSRQLEWNEAAEHLETEGIYISDRRREWLSSS